VSAGSLRGVVATRYVTPLREGGSLPGLCEADDDGLYVVKFRGAGQGAKALVAEVICAALARDAGLAVPELVTVELDPALGRAEPDPEIQDLLDASAGVNLGVDFLPGALPFVPAAGPEPAPQLAADIVWLDAFITNVDRTAQNPNLLWWHGELWCIDHGAALYRHHEGLRPADATARFAAIAQHVLLPYAGSIAEADARLAPRLDRAAVERAVAAVPDAWLADPDRDRPTYVSFLCARLAAPRAFAEEAEDARARA